MRRTRLIFATAIVVALVGAACSKSSTPSGGTSGASAGPKKAVGMALPGPKNDKGFNQGHYEGLLDAGKKFGVKTAYVENVVDPQARRRVALGVKVDHHHPLAGVRQTGPQVDGRGALAHPALLVRDGDDPGATAPPTLLLSGGHFAPSAQFVSRTHP